MAMAPRPVSPPRVAGAFEHLGYLYRDPQEYLATAAGFVQSGLAAGSPVLVAVPPLSLDLLRDGLGTDAGGVEFVDMSQAGRNPLRIIPAVLLEFLARHPGRRVSIIGEPVWPGRTGTEYPACAIHEALINHVLAGHDAAILCPYDVVGLPGYAILDAHRTHPVLVDGAGNQWASIHYDDPLHIAGMFNQPMSTPPAAVAVMTYRHPWELATVRDFVIERAGEAGIEPERLGQVAVAVNELATNTIEHTSGPGTVRVWADPSAFVCEVQDTGHLADPRAGSVPPAPHQPGGRGLVLVNQLCDLVRVHSYPGQTTVRTYHYR